MDHVIISQPNRVREAARAVAKVVHLILSLFLHCIVDEFLSRSGLENGGEDSSRALDARTAPSIGSWLLIADLPVPEMDLEVMAFCWSSAFRAIIQSWCTAPTTYGGNALTQLNQEKPANEKNNDHEHEASELPLGVNV
ncbi:hypothetical protein VNO80_04460 [Phaseolus coccineus]|uniref:Uncharacterized protein n=1 Tax=Phaseolus coccineus TaxID=3886 RepID=A0AAN9RNR7_PHACN